MKTAFAGNLGQSAIGNHKNPIFFGEQNKCRQMERVQCPQAVYLSKFLQQGNCFLGHERPKWFNGIGRPLCLELFERSHKTPMPDVFFTTQAVKGAIKLQPGQLRNVWLPG